MQSLALVGSLSVDRREGPAKGDRKVLPLGAVLTAATAAAPPPPTTTSRGGSGSGGNGTLSAAAPATSRPAGAKGCPLTLPPPPSGPPIMVLFPATLHVAIFPVRPRPVMLASGVLCLVALVGSWVWGWELASAAGLASGLAAGFLAGVGVRSRPVGGLGCVALSVLGVALLGGGRSSLALGTALALSTLWRHGWWLYLQPECAPVAFILLGTTADVALGFLLSCLFQVHRTQPQQEQSASTDAKMPATAVETPIVREELWKAVTPPGVAGRRIRRRV